MSMPAWLTDVPTVPNNNDNGTFESSMSFMATPTSANFDSHPPLTQQFQQRMQNGNVRNPSPGLHNSAYQTQSTIPAKRPRAQGGDSYGASPGQSAAAPQTSRSQTPQHGPYSGLHGSSNGPHQVQPPTPYQHLRQGGSSNASPSPIMQDQNFNPPPVSQRLQTASPSPFSPAMQNFVPQASPPQSDYGGLVDNLQNGGHTYGHAMSYGAPPMQHLTPPPGAVSSGRPGGMPASYAPTQTHLQQRQQYQQQYQQQQQQQQHQQHQQHQQLQLQLQLQQQQQQQQQQQRRMYELRQQEMVRRLAANNNAAQHRHQSSVPNPAVGSSSQMVNYQQAIRAQQMQNSMPRSGNAELLIRNIGHLMRRRGLPFNPHPTVGGRPLHIVQLYSAVMRLGGSKRVTATGSWPAVATRLHFNSVQYPTAAQDMQSYWNTNLAPCEELLHKYQTQSRRESGSNETTPVKQINPKLNNNRQAHVNGYATPQPNQIHTQPPRSTGTPQAMPSDQQQDTVPLTKGVLYQPADSTVAKRKTQPSPWAGDTVRENPFDNMPRQIEKSPIYHPTFRDISNHGAGEGSTTHGGVNVHAFEKVISDLERHRPNVPAAQELGVVDLRALTMSLRCGAHAEVRLALDTLATLSRIVLDRGGRVIEASEDLIDALVECADEQVEMLAENASEVSDVMLISPYEDVMRGCRHEMETLQEVHEFGTPEYNLDRAVDKLICITTILRNFSFSLHNHSLLAEPCVIKFMTTVIRYLGTRNMLLRTNRNTLDFTKDIVIYLSNVSQTIELSGKEDALCLLHFLLSFAPSPAPTNPGCETVMFTSYSPTVHCYLPPAVDSLAKILTRDEPNRTYYRSIFATDSASSPPYDLLTRTIALAVAPIPNNQTRVLETVVVRQPFLAQGLLAAGILVTLIPTTEHTLARAWLASQDGFALRLLSIVLSLSNKRPPVAQVHPSTRQLVGPDPGPEDYGMITTHAIALLRKLAQRAKDSDSQEGGIPIGVVPKRSTMLRLLRGQVIDPSIVQQVCAYAQLGD